MANIKVSQMKEGEFDPDNGYLYYVKGGESTKIPASDLVNAIVSRAAS